MSKVSVILTSYDRTELLRQAILSVLGQTRSDIELIIIDDGSPQPTRQIIEEFTSQHPIIYIQTDKKNEDRYKVCDYAQNINIAIRRSSGDYISYLTCDDIYYPPHIAVLADVLDTDPEKMIVFGDQRVVQYDDDTGERRHLGDRILPMVVLEAAGLVDHNAIMHRRSCIDLAGYWPENAEVYYAGDAAYWKALNRYWPFYRVPMITHEHRFHRDSIQSLTYPATS